jgi:hypothetical protein
VKNLVVCAQSSPLEVHLFVCAKSAHSIPNPHTYWCSLFDRQLKRLFGGQDHLSEIDQLAVSFAGQLLQAAESFVLVQAGLFYEEVPARSRLISR